MDEKIAVIAGATGYIGKFAVLAFKEAGYRVRAITRDAARLAAPGPFHAPGVTDSCDEVIVAEVTKPETLAGVLDGAEVVFSSVGISRQRDMLSFEQVDYQANKNLVDEAVSAGVGKFVYVSMWGPEVIADLAITRAHERVVEALAESGLDFRVVRPSGYFSDMGVLMDMARRGRSYIVGPGTNRFNPVHGADVARVAVEAVDSDLRDHGVGGPDVYTQNEAARLAFEVLGKEPKLTHLPMGLGARGSLGRPASQRAVRRSRGIHRDGGRDRRGRTAERQAQPPCLLRRTGQGLASASVTGPTPRRPTAPGRTRHDSLRSRDAGPRRPPVRGRDLLHRCEHWENFLFSDATGVAPLPDRIAHPAHLFHVAINGVGTSITELFRLAGSGPGVPVSIDYYDWRIHSPLREDEPYTLTGGITDFVREENPDGPTRDSFAYEISITDSAGAPVADVGFRWHYWRFAAPGDTA